MPVLAKDESERLDRIERGIQYGVTFKDLHFLVRLARRLEKKCETLGLTKAQPALPFEVASSPRPEMKPASKVRRFRPRIQPPPRRVLQKARAAR